MIRTILERSRTAVLGSIVLGSVLGGSLAVAPHIASAKQGADDKTTEVRGGHGADDTRPDDRGGHNDDGPNHR